MVNHFYTLLANLTYDSSNRAEHISNGYTTLQLNDQLERFRVLVFPANLSRAQKLTRALQIVAMINSTTLAAKLTAVDSRITYAYDNNGDMFTFTVGGEQPTSSERWDALALLQTIKAQDTSLKSMLTLKAYNDEQYSETGNAVYDLAAIMICYVSRVMYYAS